MPMGGSKGTLGSAGNRGAKVKVKTPAFINLGPYYRMSDFTTAFKQLKLKHKESFAKHSPGGKKISCLNQSVVDSVADRDNPPGWAKGWRAGIRET